MVRRFIPLVALVLFAPFAALAQIGTGSLRGKVTDKKDGSPLPFVNIVVENRGTLVGGGTTDFDGKYDIKPIDPGTYDVMVSYVGYQPVKQTGVVINSNKITFLDFSLQAGVELKEFEVIKYEVPLINKDGGSSGGIVTREDIVRMPQRSATGIAAMVGGTSDAGTGGGISIRGARSDNTYYYIDGVKVPAGAGTGLPKSAIEEVQVITGGLPANYGDVTGGVINITTRGPSRAFFGGVDYLTSGYRFGNDVTDIYGLDKFAFNQLEASLSGPIFFQKDSVGNKTRPLLGFFLSGQYTNVVDGAPFYHGDTRVNRDKRAELQANPLRVVNVGGEPSVFYNTDFLRESDFETTKARSGAAQQTVLGSGKIDISVGPTMNFTVGGSLDLGSFQNYNYRNSLLNSVNNPQQKDLTWRAFAKFTQRFNTQETQGDKRATVRNAFYTLQFDYSQYRRKVESQDLGDDVWRYGHIGGMNTYRMNNYTLDFARQAFIHDGFRDTLVTFNPGTANPDLAALNSQFFTLFDQPPTNIFNPDQAGPYSNFQEIQARNGLLNGQAPRDVYSLWNNIGQINNQFLDRRTEQFRIMASGAADVGQHAVSVGIEYEQLTTRQYNLGPVGLWTRARQLANFHLRELDRSDSTVNYFFGTLPFITYDRLVGDDQPFFDRSLRTALGLDVRGTDFIDVDALDPSTFSLDMFSAEELLNDGNNLADFYGFDHVGNRISGRTTFEDFFDERDANGNFTRVQRPYSPQYMAGFVMDKFAFDDIIFNVGVRVDRWDANQKVLEDKYLFRPAFSAGDAVPSSSVQAALDNRPGNIGNDYVVYVNDAADPTAVVGYRNGDTWYNADGQVLTDPTVLRQADGIQPYLVNYGTDPDGSLRGSKMRKEAFVDYKPVVNVMPRIAFSFPISDEAVFFAHYDVLTQRPSSAARLDMINYAYIETVAGTELLTNPDLRPTKTIDYELGFQQVLTKSSSLKIAAFYRELRDMIQAFRVVEAWPVTYRTYTNIDFGTVKGFTLSYDLRRTGNIWMRANYTLQFADGTGSGINTGINLINSGQPNLRNISPLDFDQRHRIQTTFDFRYGAGSDYNGPMWFGSRVFERMGVNLVAILGSGTPYSASGRVINEGAGVGNHTLLGSLNGSRLPWQFTTEMQIDRDIPLTLGQKDGDKGKAANLNIYLLITNLFNTQNITGVWRATGSPTDDGYLASPDFINDINTKVDPQSYRDLYAQKVFNPFNFGAPRTIRIGARFDF
ncbi:MAG: carboxypeptidase regulatory-like domain-containing protein [Flavobacteriales bacterium]|nr:carboxypeptidase regulatory-like domain-containing protein [Flavobacteriales bacterium]